MFLVKPPTKALHVMQQYLSCLSLFLHTYLIAQRNVISWYFLSNVTIGHFAWANRVDSWFAQCYLLHICHTGWHPWRHVRSSTYEVGIHSVDDLSTWIPHDILWIPMISHDRAFKAKPTHGTLATLGHRNLHLEQMAETLVVSLWYSCAWYSFYCIRSCLLFKLNPSNTVTP